MKVIATYIVYEFDRITLMYQCVDGAYFVGSLHQTGVFIGIVEITEERAKQLMNDAYRRFK
jgi:hypothetical protein